MTLSEDVRSLREKTLQLTQQQFAALTGLGVATINRYENGTEPTTAHRQLLDGLSHPENLLRFLRDKGQALGTETHRRLVTIAEREIAQSEMRRVESIQQKESDELLKGKRDFDLSRLTAMVRFFTRDGEWKTKLNKLLFYADFVAYRQVGKSLSGTRYVVGPYGPIPDGQEALYTALIETSVIEAREEFTSESGEPVEKLVASSAMDRRAFTVKELHILEAVKSFFATMNARQIADYSHEEQAYQSHGLGDPIPYADAETLRPLPNIETPSSPRESMAQLAKRLTNKIPAEEMKRLPRDASRNVDYYLYKKAKLPE